MHISFVPSRTKYHPLNLRSISFDIIIFVIDHRPISNRPLYVCACVFLSLSVCACVSLSVCMYVCLCVYVALSALRTTCRRTPTRSRTRRPSATPSSKCPNEVTHMTNKNSMGPSFIFRTGRFHRMDCQS